MSALTIPRDTAEAPRGFFNPGVAAATTIFAGAIVALNNAGHAVPAADAANLRVIGRAEETVTNTGSAGDLKILVKRGVFAMNNAPTNAVGITHIGRLVYIADDNTVQSATGTNSVKAGIAISIEGPEVFVDTTLAPAI